MAKQIVCSKANLCLVSVQNSSVACVFSQSVEKRQDCGAARSSCIAGFPRSAVPFWGMRALDKCARAGQSVMLQNSRVWWAREASLSLAQSNTERNWRAGECSDKKICHAPPPPIFFFPFVLTAVLLQPCQVWWLWWQCKVVTQLHKKTAGLCSLFTLVTPHTFCMWCGS